jgi:hypothetical protein
MANEAIRGSIGAAQARNLLKLIGFDAIGRTVIFAIARRIPTNRLAIGSFEDQTAKAGKSGESSGRFITRRATLSNVVESNSWRYEAPR